MSDPITPPTLPPAFVPYEVAGIGTVTAHTGDTYEVTTAEGRVHGYTSPSGTPTQEHAAEELAFALAHPPAFPDPVPDSVTRRQLLLALFAATGVKDSDILSSLTAIADPAARYRAAVEFGNATEFRRAHPLIAQLATALGLTAAQVDEIFRAAEML